MESERGCRRHSNMHRCRRWLLGRGGGGGGNFEFVFQGGCWTAGGGAAARHSNGLTRRVPCLLSYFGEMVVVVVMASKFALIALCIGHRLAARGRALPAGSRTTV